MHVCYLNCCGLDNPAQVAAIFSQPSLFAAADRRIILASYRKYRDPRNKSDSAGNSEGAVSRPDGCGGIGSIGRVVDGIVYNDQHSQITHHQTCSRRRLCSEGRTRH